MGLKILELHFPARKEGKKRGGFISYITQTIISEITILQCQMINRNKNRIKISSKNDLNMKSFSDMIDRLSLLLRLSTAKL